MTQGRSFYEQDGLYRIFIHQAILSATILALCDADAMRELPHLVSYPLHMHREYPPDRRPVKMNALITCRYERFFQDPDWERTIPVEEPLRSWLREHL